MKISLNYEISLDVCATYLRTVSGIRSKYDSSTGEQFLRIGGGTAREFARSIHSVDIKDIIILY